MFRKLLVSSQNLWVLIVNLIDLINLLHYLIVMHSGCASRLPGGFRVVLTSFGTRLVFRLGFSGRIRGTTAPALR